MPITGVPVFGGQMIVATQGAVEARYLGSDAAYFSFLSFGNGGIFALFNKATPVGTTVNLGTFAAGTELMFSLFVSDTHTTFVTGSGANPDGLSHARAVTQFNPTLNKFVTEVGFEDLFGGGDHDYNDFVFRLTNVYDPPPGSAPELLDAVVPEPTTLGLFGVALAALGAVRRKRKGRDRSA